MKKGFTITELIVAIGLLAAVLAASTMIFHYAIEAQRTAMATAEIMRTVRAITDQLNMDFKGLRTTDAPMIMEFHRNARPGDPNVDSLVFFAGGDFQDSSGLVRGPSARIYYGQSKWPDPNSTTPGIIKQKILTRKQVILDQTGTTNEYEPDSLLQQVNKYLATDPNTNGNIDAANWIAHPDVNSNTLDNTTMPMYLAKGVDDFSIMYCYKGDIDATSHAINWRRPVNEKRFFGLVPPLTPYFYFIQYPNLIKFTFTLYDSKGILKGGRRFEHIVYIGQ
jgi:prepilin-type N-terminal cleavage/methylation domain-containing protein